MTGSEKNPRSLENDKIHLFRSRIAILGRYAANMRHDVRSKVVVLHFGRAGSTVIGQTLASQQSIDVVWDGEVFQKLHRDEQVMLKIARDPYRFLDWRASRATDLYGTEIKVNPGGHSDQSWLDAGPVDVVGSLAARGYEIVYLRRRNLLRWVISSIAGRHRGSYHTTAAAGHQASIHIPMDGTRWYGPASDLATYLRQARQRDDQVLSAVRSLGRHLVLEFADDIQVDPNTGAKKVFDFLGIAGYEPIVPELKPTVGRVPLIELIANHDEVASHIGEDLYHLFDD